MVVILNPTAGRGRGARKQALVEKRLPDATILATTCEGEAEALARETVQNGASVVVAGGGDGTLGEVLNGVFSASSTDASSTKRPVLGVLPLGTGNDFARTLGIGTDMEKALQTLEAGRTRAVDVGEVELGQTRRAFLNVCGAGIDSLNAIRINAARQHPFWRHIKGTSAYIGALAIELCRLEATKLTLSLEIENGRETVELRTVLCAVANARSYGGGMLVAPQASIDDGLLDVVVIAEAGRLEFMRAFPGVFKGTHLSHPKVKTFRARHIRIESQPPLPVLVDGEVLGQTPATFQVGTRTINFLAPA